MNIYSHCSATFAFHKSDNMNIRFDYRTGRVYEVYYKHLADKVKGIIGTIITGTVSMVSLLNIGCSYLGHNNTGRTILFAFQVLLFALLIWYHRKMKPNMRNLIEDGIIRRNYHQRIAGYLPGIEWKVVENGNECIGLSRDNEYFMVYFYEKTYVRYRLLVFKRRAGDEYESLATIRLNRLVPFDLYNPAVFSLIGNNDIFLWNDSLPTSTPEYSAHVQTMSRKHLIDEILADLS